MGRTSLKTYRMDLGGGTTVTETYDGDRKLFTSLSGPVSYTEYHFEPLVQRMEGESLDDFFKRCKIARGGK